MVEGARISQVLVEKEEDYDISYHVQNLRYVTL